MDRPSEPVLADLARALFGDKSTARQTLQAYLNKRAREYRAEYESEAPVKDWVTPSAIDKWFHGEPLERGESFEFLARVCEDPHTQQIVSARNGMEHLQRARDQLPPPSPRAERRVSAQTAGQLPIWGQDNGRIEIDQRQLTNQDNYPRTMEFVPGVYEIFRRKFEGEASLSREVLEITRDSGELRARWWHIFKETTKPIAMGSVLVVDNFLWVIAHSADQGGRLRVACIDKEWLGRDDPETKVKKYEYHTGLLLGMTPDNAVMGACIRILLRKVDALPKPYEDHLLHQSIADFKHPDRELILKFISNEVKKGGRLEAPHVDLRLYLDALKKTKTPGKKPVKSAAKGAKKAGADNGKKAGASRRKAGTSKPAAGARKQGR